jgi:hypothetical protein
VRGTLWLVGVSVFACVLLLMLVSTRELGSAAVVATITAWHGMVAWAAAWVLVRLLAHVLAHVLAAAKTVVWVLALVPAFPCAAARAGVYATTEVLTRIAKAVR